jgi:predicted ester cyclase
MPLEENKAIVRSLVEAFNKHNLALLCDFIAPDFVDHTRQLRGLETMKQYLTMVYKNFPDFHATIEDVIAEGDKVWILEKCTMTHTVEYRGIAPTGKKLTETFVEIYRIVDGKVVEMWTVIDELDFLIQLGVIQYTEKAKELFPKHIS